MLTRKELYVMKEDSVDGFMDFAVGTAKKAGAKALAYYGKGDTAVKFDDSLVTEAELSIRGLFEGELKKLNPLHRIFDEANEISRQYSHSENRYLWVIDAIDGVANFQAGIPIWGISIAMLENFWPVLGVFFMPVTGDIFYSRAGGPAYHVSTVISTSSQEGITDESLLFTFSRFNHHYRTSFPGKIRTMGCAGAHICYVAMGRAEAAILANHSFSELAAASVILESAGGNIFTIEGAEFYLSNYLDGKRIAEHLVAAPASNLSQVRACLELI